MSHLKRQAPAVINYATKFATKMKPNFPTLTKSRSMNLILVPRGHAPFGQHQESRPLTKSNTGSPLFTDFSSLCACSESSLTNLIGSGLNLLCLRSHSKPECRWTWPEVAILGADQKERGLWGREWHATSSIERALSNNMNNDRADGHCHNFAVI